MPFSFLTLFKFKPSLLGWLGFLVFIASCKDEKKFDAGNQAPSIRISVDSIGLPDSLRLFTQVKLSWAGNDADGYVAGYRVAWSTDSGTAATQVSTAPLISATDSTFLFNFSGASDNATIYFFVLAQDDKGKLSELPGFLKIPVRNSPPVISFLADGLPVADTIWSVTSLPYSFSDPDGAQNIDSVYLRINNGPWVGLPKNLSFISIVPEDPGALGETNGLVYAGENLATLNNEPSPIPNLRIAGMQLDARNQFFIKVKDLAGSIDVDTTDIQYFIKRKTSDLLLVDAFKGEGAFIGDTLYTSLLSGIATYDRIDMNASNGVNQPKFWNSTFYLLCKQYKKVFWFSDILTNLPGQTPLMLTTASTALNQYLRFNGKLLASTNFPDAPNQLSTDDPIFSLIPISKISDQSNLTRLRRNFPVVAQKPGYTDLKSTNNIVSGIDIFEVKPGVDTLYMMPKSSLTSTYTGPDLPIGLISQNPFNNKTNLVFFGMELTLLSGDRPALINTFNKILNEEFNW